MTSSAPSEEALRARREGTLVLPEVTMAYGGKRIRYRSRLPGAVRFAVAPPHDDFVVDDGGPVACDLAVTLGPVSPSSRPPRLDAGGHWQLRSRDDGGDEICFIGRLDSPEPEPLTLLSLDETLAHGTVTQVPLVPGSREFAVGFPVDEYVANRVLARDGALVLHAATVMERGEATVFAGHSGAGKSTLARIAEGCGARVLSDDRTILTWRDAVTVAHGTPWHGSLRRGASRGAPVRAIHLLVQAPENRVEPVPAEVAFAELYVRVIQPSVDPLEARRVVQSLSDIVQSVPVTRLHFTPTAAGYRQLFG